MSTKLSALLDIAVTIIPALGSLAGDDKTGKLANDIVGVLKKVAKEDDPEQIKSKVESNPAVKSELEKRLAELANQQAEQENRAFEEKRRLELEEVQKGLKAQEQKHQDQLELIKKKLESTNAARAFAQKSALSERAWVSGINPLLSIIITFAFLTFIYLVATIPLGDTRATSPGAKQDDQTTEPPAPQPGGEQSGDQQRAPQQSDQNPTGTVGNDNKDNEVTEVINNKDVFLVAFGALATGFATVIGFHFGSSSGSKRKTRLQRIYGTRGTSIPPGPKRPPTPQGKGTRVLGRKDDEPGQATHPFEAFWMKNLSHIEHFNWEELLFKGASNARFTTNTDPDPSLYPNVVPLVNLLENIRKEIGAPVKLTSIYRSPAYNRNVGGATSSRHLQFDAADFQALGSGAGNSDKWFKIAKKLRDKGEFEGGIGVYGSFVHVDTRGHNATWDNR